MKPLFFVTSLSFCPYGLKNHNWLTKNYVGALLLYTVLISNQLSTGRFRQIGFLSKPELYLTTALLLGLLTLQVNKENENQVYY